MARVSSRSGFSLIELLVVVAIIAILMALLLPAVQKVREAANRMKCGNHLKQITIAAHGFHHDYKRFPSGWYMWVHLTPYMEEESAYRQCTPFSIPAWDGGQNWFVGVPPNIQKHIIKILICPSSKLSERPMFDGGMGFSSFAMSSYGGNAGTGYAGNPNPTNGMFFFNDPNRPPVRIEDVTDGTGNTLFFGERSHFDPMWEPCTGFPLLFWGWWSWSGGWDLWMTSRVPINLRMRACTDVTDRQTGFGSEHTNGANFVFVDGSVRFLHNSLPLVTLQALSTRKQDEIIRDDV